MHTPPTGRTRAALLLAAALAVASCNGDSGPTAPEGSARPLPARFTVTGSASSTESDGATVSCSLDLIFELVPGPRSFAGMLEYDGVHGGSIQRTVLDAQGNGISLWPDVHGQVVVRSIAPDRIEIAIPVNAETESRFWRELSLLRGTFTGDTATGTWRCAPFDVDSHGYVDTRYTAPGTWVLTPIA